MLNIRRGLFAELKRLTDSGEPFPEHENKRPSPLPQERATGASLASRTNPRKQIP
jgi:hypothetical protein